MAQQLAAMARDVPAFKKETFPQGSLEKQDSEASKSPRLNDQMTPRALWEIVKHNQKWARLLDDPSGAFRKGDIIDVRYQKYLTDVVPIMVSQDVSFKTAVEILAQKQGKQQSQGSHASGSPTKKNYPKEVMKDSVIETMPKLREALEEKIDEKMDEKSQDLQAINEKDEFSQELEPKALDVDVEKKSLAHRTRDFTKASGRSSSEPITPKRPDKEQLLLRQEGLATSSRADQPGERVVYVETRPQIPQKAVAIQTDEAPSSQLLQPLLSRPSVASAKPKARKKKEEKDTTKKELPLQYQECSCGRICFSTAMKFIVACFMVLALIWCAENSKEVTAFFNNMFFQEPAATSGAHAKKHHQMTESKEHEAKHPAQKHQEPSHKEKPESHSHEGAALEEPVHPTTTPKSKLELAKETLDKEMNKLEHLDKEQAETARVGELARLSQKENEEHAADSPNKDQHLRQAALDAEVQARVAQQELDEDSEIRKQKKKVKDAQARVDELESAKRDKQTFLAQK